MTSPREPFIVEPQACSNFRIPRTAGALTGMVAMRDLDKVGRIHCRWAPGLWVSTGGQYVREVVSFFFEHKQYLFSELPKTMKNTVTYKICLQFPSQPRTRTRKTSRISNLSTILQKYIFWIFSIENANLAWTLFSDGIMFIWAGVVFKLLQGVFSLTYTHHTQTRIQLQRGMIPQFPRHGVLVILGIQHL